ncbi:MAG: hypothetical protein HN337_04765 [Deltaproteobacteria bacterium]|jgi:hypothetical protein|nr:hypothetical protein [Deltaproteobacteria bacterium]
MSDLDIKRVDTQITPEKSIERSPEVVKAPSEQDILKPEDPENLYESLQSKRELFKMLELQGYIKKKEIEPIEIEINKALADLEKIIDEESGSYLEQFIKMES